MDKTYDAAYFQRWYRRADIGGSARPARKVALAVASAEYYRAADPQRAGYRLR